MNRLSPQLLELGRLILARNREINLTGARDLPTLINDHILDALTLVPIIRERGGTGSDGDGLLVDIGSGGGFPALPLAIVLRGLDVLCIESVAKKAKVLRELSRALELTRVTVLNDRAETVAHDPRWREKANWATARGVGAMATTCELALPFLQIGGIFLAQKGAEAGSEIRNAGAALDRLGGRVESNVSVDCAAAPTKRRIVLIEKIAPTPDALPRRPGLPAKRPLKGGKP